MATVTEIQGRTIEDEPEGFYEVVDGKVVEKPEKRAYDSEILGILLGLVGIFARENRLGRAVGLMLFRIDPRRRLERRPDVAFVARERWPIERRAPKTAAWEVVPDLAIEVISPNNKTVDDARKLEDYFRAGVRVVWIVYPEVNKVHVYASPTEVAILALGDELEGGDVLPGFRLGLRELFGEEGEPAAE